MSNSTEILAQYKNIVPNIRIVYQLDRDQLQRAKALTAGRSFNYLTARNYELEFGGPRQCFLSISYQAVLREILGVETLPAPKLYAPYDDDRLWWNEDLDIYLVNRADWVTYAAQSRHYAVPARFVAQSAIFTALQQPGDRNEILHDLIEQYGKPLVDDVMCFRDRFCHGGG